MSDEASIVLRTLQSAFGLYGAVYIVTSIAAPAWFLDTIAINTLGQRRARRDELRNIIGTREPWWAMPVVFLKLVAVGVVIYAATYAVIAVIPYSWGSHNEDGEWESVRWTVQSTVAFIGSFGLVGQLEKNAEVLVWGPLERKARQELQDGVRYASYSVPEILEKVQKHVNEKLAPEPHLPKTYKTEVAASLHRAVVGGLHR